MSLSLAGSSELALGTIIKKAKSVIDTMLTSKELTKDAHLSAMFGHFLASFSSGKDSMAMVIGPSPI